MIDEVMTTPELFAIIFMCILVGYVLAKITNKK